MYYSYWNMSLSSIEKRLQIPSRTTGIITAINDVSHIAVVLLVAHFCGKGHRPRYLAMGSLLLGFSVLLFATPELLAPKWDAENMQVTNLTTPKIDRETCLSDADALTTADKCDAESHTQRGSNLWPLLLLGLAQTLLGIATTAPIVLAMPFIDDNVSIRNAPIFFGKSCLDMPEPSKTRANQWYQHGFISAVFVFDVTRHASSKPLNGFDRIQIKTNALRNVPNLLLTILMR